MVIELDSDSAEIDDLAGLEKLSIEIKPYHPKRSLTANAYAWVLIHELASKLNTSPEIIYKETIRSIGGVSELMQCKAGAVDKLRKSWESKGIGWQMETLGNRNGWVDCIMYYGSSTYDTAQMTRFIDSLVNECKEQGIDTMSERERSLLLDKWNER